LGLYAVFDFEWEYLVAHRIFGSLSGRSVHMHIGCPTDAQTMPERRSATSAPKAFDLPKWLGRPGVFGVVGHLPEHAEMHRATPV
jgi:hypothetical protein